MTIKELRTACGMTQTKFGEHLNIPMRTIQNWENGVSVPPDYVLELIEYRLRTEELIK